MNSKEWNEVQLKCLCLNLLTDKEALISTIEQLRYEHNFNSTLAHYLSEKHFNEKSVLKTEIINHRLTLKRMVQKLHLANEKIKLLEDNELAIHHNNKSIIEYNFVLNQIYLENKEKEISAMNENIVARLRTFQGKYETLEGKVLEFERNCLSVKFFS